MRWRRAGSRATSSGSTTTSSCWSRPCCASGSRTHASASSSTSPSPPPRSSGSCRSASGSSRACSGPTCLASTPPPTSGTSPRRRSGSSAPPPRSTASAGRDARCGWASSPWASTRRTSPRWPPRRRWRSSKASHRREGHQLLLGLDRLDYTKGIQRRLLAFEALLRAHPELTRKVRLVQVAVPSRENVEAYRELREEVDALVGRIHGEFATPDWSPIHYLYRGLSQAEIVALYRATDAVLVTPLRDGMNLVAKEFVAARSDGDGVLVLSEFAGAAAEMTEA